MAGMRVFSHTSRRYDSFIMAGIGIYSHAGQMDGRYEKYHGIQIALQKIISIRPLDLLQSIQGQTCHGYLNHDIVVGRPLFQAAYEFILLHPSNIRTRVF